MINTLEPEFAHALKKQILEHADYGRGVTGNFLCPLCLSGRVHYITGNRDHRKVNFKCSNAKCAKTL
jgi:hypothetical protein